MMELKTYLSLSTNPWFNQAVEDVLFNSLKKNQAILLIWRNRPSINIGKDQNPWLVCNTQNVHKNNLSIVRRQTYGGAVYQDPGHSNFSIMGDQLAINSTTVNTILKLFLEQLNLIGRVNHNNEIIISEKKISNSVNTIVDSKFLQHCTIRVNTDISVVESFTNRQYEESDPYRLLQKYGNLSNSKPFINHETIEQALMNACCKHLNVSTKGQRLNINPLPSFPGLGKKLHVISSWDWNYGQSPEFNRQLIGHFSWGKVELDITVIKGTIQYVSFKTPSLFEPILAHFTKVIIGYPYQTKSITSVMGTLMIHFSDSHKALLEFGNWLEKEWQ
ncbi:lipoate--protein ligase [Photobacterium profundum]|nr:lipoate protein ligase C-terminal domain-containing protein [Photobacterium profundum]PSV59880.1 lipoate--protein ligase [Photobacterium profundum]